MLIKKKKRQLPSLKNNQTNSEFDNFTFEPLTSALKLHICICVQGLCVTGIFLFFPLLSFGTVE